MSTWGSTPQRPGDDGEALLKLAVQLEKRAKAFFGERALGLTAGTPEHTLYLELEAVK